MKKEIPFSKLALLAEAVYSEPMISCSKCPEETGFGIGIDELEAAEAAYRSGWRPTKNNVYCPKCAKAYLNLRKIKKPKS